MGRRDSLRTSFASASSVSPSWACDAGVASLLVALPSLCLVLPLGFVVGAGVVSVGLVFCCLNDRSLSIDCVKATNQSLQSFSFKLTTSLSVSSCHNILSIICDLPLASSHQSRFPTAPVWHISLNDVCSYWAIAVVRNDRASKVLLPVSYPVFVSGSATKDLSSVVLSVFVGNGKLYFLGSSSF